MLPTDRTPITIEGAPLPLLLHQMTGQEELGRLFHYDLELYSESPDVPAAQLLGKPLTVCLSKTGGVRFFNGIVTRLQRLGRTDKYTVLHATLSPRLWLLQRTKDCRVYQGMSVPDVVQTVLREHNIPFESKLLDDAYPEWDYLTQYRESDFAFISRLMEREGIYYYFTHAQGEHKMILSDSISSHKTVPGYEILPTRLPGASKLMRDHLTEWHRAHESTASAVTLEAHDFRLRQGADIKGAKIHTADDKEDFLELYDFAGHHAGAQDDEAGDAKETREAGEHYAQVQLQAERAEAERIVGAGNARGLEVGALFTIEDINVGSGQLLVVRAQLALQNPSLDGSGDSATGDICHVSFSAIASNRPFRPKHLAEPPFAGGPETAIVVGPDDEEIWTDKHGRIRVQFHWDREGKEDESSTCWVRVGQLWAGPNWGSQFIPRIGQEVIVQFLGGNPDRPIITGTVYNANNQPPYTLPDNKTQSGIKTRSTKGATANNFNEIRFEDKKGGEELFIQAEKNKRVNVKHDRSASVGANDSVSVGGDRSVSVTGNLAVTVSGGGKSPNHSSHSVTGKYNLHASDTIEEDAPNHIKLTCGGSSILIEPNKITLMAGGKAFVVLDEHVLAQSSEASAIVLDANAFTKASGGAAVLLDAHVLAQSKAVSQLLLDGNATLTSKADVKVGGANVEISGDQKVAANGGGAQLELAPAGATLSGAKVAVSGQSTTEITGALVKIN